VATEMLTTGIAHTLVQNQVYALPGCLVNIRSTAAVETSQDGTTFAAVTLTNNQADISAMFVRATGVGTIVSIKLY